MGAQLRVYRQKIRSAQTTKKITRAMELIAASRIQKAKARVEASTPYATAITRAVSAVATHSNTDHPLLTEAEKVERAAVVIFTSDRGLAGAFNSSIVRLAVREYAQKLAAEGKTVKIMTVGKKGLDALRRQYRDQIVESMDIRGNRPVDYEFAASIADKILTRFENGEFDVATLFYSEFRSVISQIPTAQRLIPAELPAVDTTAKAAAGNAALEFEPSEEAILETLLPKNLTVQIYRALLENAASGQGARMSAMDSATRNAGEMIKKQTLIYNRTRQAMITKELIEIISGAEAL